MDSTLSHIDHDGSGELYISNITSAIQEPTGQFDRIITVCQNSIEDNVSDEQEYSFYCLSDGNNDYHEGECTYELFEQATEELYEALSDGETVLIHCHAGQSRSVSVATAALGQLLELSRSDALELVHYYRPVHQYPEMILMDFAKEYINKHTNISQIPFDRND